MTKIVKVGVKGDYILEILLENGSSVLLNMESRLDTLRFGMLADKEFFEKVTTDGDFIRWGQEIEISLSEVFQLANK